MHRRVENRHPVASGLLLALGWAIALAFGGCGRPPEREISRSAPDSAVVPTRRFDLAELISRRCRELTDADSAARAQVLALYEGRTGRACVFRTGHTIEGQPTRDYLLVDDGRARAVRDHPRSPEGLGLVNRIDRCTLGSLPSPGGYCATGMASCVRLTCRSPDVQGARFIF